jgi:hypothetical protein
MPDYANIAANPEAHGFRWSVEVVHKDLGSGHKHEVGQVPIAVVTNPTDFEATFPGQILDSLDGSSVRVKCQNKNRRRLEKDPKVPVDTMKVETVQMLSGVKARTTDLASLSTEALEAELARRKAE